MKAKDKTVRRPKVWPAILSIIVLSLISQETASSQVTVALSPTAKQQFFSVSGSPLASACINTYITGTSTPLATYVDGTGATQNSNPIILDGGGFANIWLQNASYRFVVVAYDGIPGNKCAAGITQYTVDNINAYAPISTGANLFLLGQTSDPAGTGGEMIYRNDIPCFRFFTTFWDCVVRLTDTQTLTNKTLASPVLTGTTTGLTTTNAALTTPTINSVSVLNSPGTYIALSNDTVTGTTLNTLTKLLASTTPLAVITATTDVGGIMGITVAGAGKSGTATVQQSGTVNCQFDGSVTNNQYVINSTTVAGDCHAQTQYPVATQVLGKVTVTSGGAGLYPMILFGPDIEVPTGIVGKADLTAQNSNIGNTTIFTPATAGLFRFSCDEVITTAATTSSTLPQCNLNWTDGDSSVAQSNNICATSSSNLLGQLCGPGSNANSFFFFAKGGVAIQTSTSGYASVGATQMVYAIHYRLEGPF